MKDELDIVDETPRELTEEQWEAIRRTDRPRDDGVAEALLYGRKLATSVAVAALIGEIRLLDREAMVAVADEAQRSHTWMPMMDPTRYRSQMGSLEASEKVMRAFITLFDAIESATLR